MKLTILGTGNAKVTKCYNTCFALNEDKEYFMIDGGGGNTILKQLEDAGISWKEISTIFVTHKHIDHLLGIIWMLRMYCQGMARGHLPKNRAQIATAVKNLPLASPRFLRSSFISD